jgi:hypothetical protein
MSGDLDDATLAQIATGYLIERRFVTCYFDEGAKGFWNDIGNIVLADGITYQGTGKVGQISDIPATTDMSLPGVTVTLSGLDDTVIAAFFSYTWHLRKIVLRSFLFAPSMASVFASPLVTFTGLMTKATRTGGDKQKAALVITVDDAMRRSVISSIGIRSDGDQRLRLSTDSAFRGVGSVGRTVQYWGQPQPHNPVYPTITGLPTKKF